MKFQIVLGIKIIIIFILKKYKATTNIHVYKTSSSLIKKKEKKKNIIISIINNLKGKEENNAKSTSGVSINAVNI